MHKSALLSVAATAILVGPVLAGDSNYYSGATEYLRQKAEETRRTVKFDRDFASGPCSDPENFMLILQGIKQLIKTAVIKDYIEVISIEEINNQNNSTSPFRYAHCVADIHLFTEPPGGNATGKFNIKYSTFRSDNVHRQPEVMLEGVSIIK